MARHYTLDHKSEILFDLLIFLKKVITWTLIIVISLIFIVCQSAHPFACLTAVFLKIASLSLIKKQIDKKANAECILEIAREYYDCIFTVSLHGH